MKVLVTGPDGFLGKIVTSHLEKNNIQWVGLRRGKSFSDLSDSLSDLDFVIHLAGVNRPENPEDFYKGNRDLTQQLVTALQKKNISAPIIYSSSIQASRDNDYGNSKRQAEDIIKNYSQTINTPCYIYRLPNIFGAGGRPNYNSAVITFCYNLSRDLPIEIHDASHPVKLVYANDVAEDFVKKITSQMKSNEFIQVEPTYSTTVGEIAELLRSFQKNNQPPENLDSGFITKMQLTYNSYYNESLKEEEKCLKS